MVALGITTPAVRMDSVVALAERRVVIRGSADTMGRGAVFSC